MGLLTRNETLTEFRLNALIGAVNRLSDHLSERLGEIVDVLDIPVDNQVVVKLNLITNILEDLVKKMATQEERLQAVAAKLGDVQTGVDRIQESLAALKESNPALEDEIGSIEAQVAALGADVAEVAPEPAPVETPAEG